MSAVVPSKLAGPECLLGREFVPRTGPMLGLAGGGFPLDSVLYTASSRPVHRGFGRRRIAAARGKPKEEEKMKVRSVFGRCYECCVVL